MGAKELLSLPPFSPSNSQTYPALCHCGTIRYTITLSPPLSSQKLIECNCSICTRNGYLLVYPSREHVQITSGEEALKTYSFGAKRTLHRFCGGCGCAVWFDPRMGGEGPDLLGVNVSFFFFLLFEMGRWREVC